MMYEEYDYVITKPELNEETLAHYGVKGMKWHKRLKSKLKTVNTKLNRAMGMTSADMITTDSGLHRVWDSKTNSWKRDSGKANSHSGSAGLKNVKTTKVKTKTTRPRSRKKTIASGRVSVKRTGRAGR